MTAPTQDRVPTVAVVLAGGTGSRVGLNIPKQLLKVPGGADRNASTRAALAALGESECNVLFHDAVRPLLSQAVVHACVLALQTYQAVDVAIPSADTIIRVDDEDHIIEIPERSRLRRGQTPQGFRLSTIRRAYQVAAEDPDFRATDDCGVVLRYLPEVPIYVVAGDEQNMKVTYPLDLFLADKLFQLASHLARPRTPDELRAMLAGCRVFRFSRSATATHVEEAATVERALEQVAAETGRIDAVVLSAAQLLKGKLSTMSDEQVIDQIRINYLGPVTVARASERYLRDSGGHLVLFTSSSYTRGRADYALYSSTKAAVVNLAQALADEWSTEGIHVNVINPERTRTPMRLQAFGDEPEGSLLESEAVASTVLDVLASDLTGHVVDVRRE